MFCTFVDWEFSSYICHFIPKHLGFNILILNDRWKNNTIEKHLKDMIDKTQLGAFTDFI